MRRPRRMQEEVLSAKDGNYGAELKVGAEHTGRLADCFWALWQACKAGCRLLSSLSWSLADSVLRSMWGGYIQTFNVPLISGCDGGARRLYGPQG